LTNELVSKLKPEKLADITHPLSDGLIERFKTISAVEGIIGDAVFSEFLEQDVNKTGKK